MDAGPSRSVEPEIKEPAVRRVWTDEEDTVLREAVKLYGSRTGPGSAWPAISQHVGGGRTNKDCRKRWFHTLDPTLKKGRWTADEDETLRRGYAGIGPQWRKLAMLVPGRTDEQVAKRWKDVLSPDLNLDAQWTPEEDALLVRLFKEHGPKWTLMSDSFPTRNGIACRNRFRRFKRTEDAPSETAESNTDLSPGDVLSFGASQDMSFFDSVLGEPSAAPDCTSPTWTSTDNGGHFTFGSEPRNNLQSFIDHILPAPLEGLYDINPIQHGATSAWLQNGHATDWLNPHSGSDQDADGEQQASNPDWLNTHSSSDQDASRSQPAPNSESPIENVWGLLVALESGRESMTLSASLVRQLLADASKKG